MACRSGAKISSSRRRAASSGQGAPGVSGRGVSITRHSGSEARSSGSSGASQLIIRRAPACSQSRAAASISNWSPKPSWYVTSTRRPDGSPPLQVGRLAGR
ncbi:MAG: hypothetical protein VB138_13535 [Burkholderia sp.]